MEDITTSYMDSTRPFIPTCTHLESTSSSSLTPISHKACLSSRTSLISIYGSPAPSITVTCLAFQVALLYASHLINFWSKATIPTIVSNQPSSVSASHTSLSLSPSLCLFARFTSHTHPHTGAYRSTTTIGSYHIPIASAPRAGQVERWGKSTRHL